MGDDLLREEGFTQIERAKPDGTIVNGGQDLEVVFAPALPAWVDEGRPVVVLAGTHVGCVQTWATPEITSLRDLRGKRVPVAAKGLNVFFNWWVSMLTSVGLDPGEVNFVLGPYDDTIFTDRKVDAILVSTWGGPLLARNAKNPGRKLVDTSFDKPWSQHFCCLLVANREWARRYPVAAKRATRAILRAQDLAAKDTASAMRLAIDKKLFPARVTLDVLLEFMKDMPMNWRDYDPEDTVRYYALRLADAKLLKTSPQQVVADGTDVAYFKQLRKELRP